EAHHDGGDGLRLRRHPGLARVRGRSGETRGLVLGRLHRRVRGRSHRLLLGQVVELAAPGTVHPADRFQRLPLAAAHQRLRDPLPLDRPGRTAHASGGAAPAWRDGASAAGEAAGGGPRAGHRRYRLSGMIQGGWEFVVAAYAVTAAVLGAYAISVFLRFRSEKTRASKET